jgi:hypothetical protein
MALPCDGKQREYEKFTEDSSGDTCVRVCVSDSSGSSTTTATIFNISLGAVDTEQSQALPANTKSFILKTRGNSLLKLSYTSTESGIKYVTIPKQGVFTDDNFYTSQTIFFQSPQTSDVVEIVAYS